MSGWYKPSQAGWTKYKTGVGYYKRGGRISTRGRNPRAYWYNSIKPSIMMKTKQNIGTKIFWFKYVNFIDSDTSGNISNAPGITPLSVTLCNDFTKIAQNFLQYKVLQYSVRFIPNSVGTDGAINVAGGPGTPGYSRPLFKRGATCLWATIDANEPYPNSIEDIISKTSTKIVNPMRTNRKMLKRPAGYPDYGELSDNGGIVQQDEWQSSLRIYGENYSLGQLPENQRFFTQVAFFKILFRSRRGE